MKNAAIFSSLIVVLLLLCAGTTQSEVVPVNYTHNGDALVGYMAVPADSPGPFPAVIIIPDRDGLNEYEKRRAELIVEDFGYIGFAADIYGDVPDLEQRAAELATSYRDDPVLFAARITAAVDAVRQLDQVDGSNMAIIGYCFGGTGVLMYAMLGINGDGVQAVVSFHGGLSKILSNASLNATTVAPKVLVLSGGDDDVSSDIMDLELQMDSYNATWEITRYSGIEHAFTVFNDTRYNEWADIRSWNSTREFLMEAFGDLTYESSPPKALNVQAVDYVDTDGTQLRGYLAQPTASNTMDDGLRPAIVIIPDWDGNNEYEQQRATLLAELGYIAFAADIYGADLQNDLSFEQRVNLTTSYRSNTTLFVQRMERGIEEVKKVEGVDTANIAVIGYCFGGTGIIELAFSGNADVKLVVSFHGGLQVLPDPSVAITPYVLVLSGGADDAHGNQTELEAALNTAEAPWEITRYSSVEHGFTNWAYAPAYSPTADYRSWQSMLSVMAEWMPLTNSTGNVSTTVAPSMIPVPKMPTTANVTMAPATMPTNRTSLTSPPTAAPVMMTSNSTSAPVVVSPPTGSAVVSPSKAPSPTMVANTPSSSSATLMITGAQHVLLSVIIVVLVPTTTTFLAF